jgi:hypothetical protein
MIDYANPVCRLAPCMPSYKCVQIMPKASHYKLKNIAERADPRWLMHLHISFHHHRRR